VQPTRESDDAVVDLADVLLRDGVVVEADVIVSVADVPLVGLELRAAVAGMAAMRDAGLLTAWDEEVRSRERDPAPPEARSDDADDP
jgi:hypothetical protein